MLPKHVSSYLDRHGKERFRYRTKEQPTRYFKAALGSKEWLAELHAFQTGITIEVARQDRISPGTVSDLCTRYYRSQDFTAQGPMTRMKNRGILEAFRAKHGEKRIENIKFDHVDAILAEKARAHPFAAKNLRKQLRRMFAHGVKCGMMKSNPVELTARVKTPRGGFHTWTEEEIEQYQNRHALGTKPRLAMEIMLWTGQRRGDVVQFGRQHIKNGRMRYEQQKGGKVLWLPVPGPMLEAIVAMPPNGHMTLLTTEYGKPFTADGFGGRMREWCDQAGLPHCSAHGLRKAISRRMAESGAGNQGIKSVTGHSGDAEVALYTREVDQALLADSTMRQLQDWEMANRQNRLANALQNTAENRDVSTGHGGPGGTRTPNQAVMSGRLYH